MERRRAAVRGSPGPFGAAGGGGNPREPVCSGTRRAVVASGFENCCSRERREVLPAVPPGSGGGCAPLVKLASWGCILPADRGNGAWSALAVAAGGAAPRRMPSITMGDAQCLQAMRTLRPRILASGTAYLAWHPGHVTFIGGNSQRLRYPAGHNYHASPLPSRNAMLARRDSRDYVWLA